MRADVDRELCLGYGTCASLAPAVFVLDARGDAYVAGDGSVATEHHAAARQAATSCPMHAIGLEE